MKKVLLYNFVWMCLLVYQASAQSHRITGKVSSTEDGAFLPGVNVVVKETGNGTTTNIDGVYELEVSEPATLVFSFIGYVTQEVAVAGQSAIDIQLKPDVRQLGEVVVTGQGIGIERRRLSTTVDIITEEQIKALPAQRIDQILQQTLPNTQIQFTSGQPGTASITRSRGISSAYNSTTPIIYVDGVRVDNLNTMATISVNTGGAQSSSLADIPVDNIERIEFIRGGAATTLYGSDAANGVIQIFTKKGSAGNARINFETQLGSVQATNDFLHFKQTADYLFRDGFSQMYRLGTNGGNEQVTYSFTGSVYGNNGFRYNNDQKQYSLRAGLSAKVNKYTQYTGSFGYVSHNFSRDYNANSDFNTFGNLENGFYGDLTKLNEGEQTTLQQKIRSIQDAIGISEAVNHFQTSHSIELQPIKKLTINGAIGLDFRTSRQRETITQKLIQIVGVNNQPSIGIYDRTFKSITGTLNARYTENVSDFSFITTIGAQFFRVQDAQVNARGTNVTPGARLLNYSAAQTATEYLGITPNYGFYGLENVGFKERYFLEVGIRVDGNAAFGKSVGQQTYSKIGLAYDVSAEPFFKGISENVLSNFRLRANYGTSGQLPPPFTNAQLINVISYNGVPSYTFGLPGDSLQRPEKTHTYEAGADIGFWNDRINVGITYFDATTNAGFFSAPFAPSTGQDAQPRNLGKITNKGWEIASSFKLVQNEKVDFAVNASFNTIKNKVVSSGNTAEFPIGGFPFLGALVKAGLPVGYLRGSIPTFDANGNFVSAQTNANLGSTLPDYYGNLGFNFAFKKRLTLFANAAYQVGAEGANLNEVLRFTNNMSDGRVPQATIDAFKRGEVSYPLLSAVWVENTDFLKVRTISLSYNVPDRFYGRMFKSLEVGFSAINPFNFASSDFDPEITGVGAMGQNRVSVGSFGYGTESAPRIFLGTIRFSL